MPFLTAAASWNGRLLFAAALSVILPVSAHAQCPDGTPPPCHGARTAAAPTPAANSVAVLYFENQSRDTADAYLAQGLTEAIIAQLGEIPRITVKSRYVVQRYSGAASQTDPAALGRALGVSYIVTGGVQRAGNRLRVTAEMARASTGNRVWGQQYERGDGDVFAIQEDIARGVATGIAGRLLPGETASLAERPTPNNEAYEHLLRGDVLLALRTPQAVLRAVSEYEAATRLDPSFASAWARIGLADAIRMDWGWGDGPPTSDSVLRRGWETAERALALDSSNSDAWMARGYLFTFRNPRTWEGAEDAVRRAVALNPRNAEAWHQLGDLLFRVAAAHPRGDSIRTLAVGAFRQALAAEPSRPLTLRQLGSFVPIPERVVLWDSALALNPENFVYHFNRAALQRLRGDTAASRATMAVALQLAPAGARLFARSLYALLALQNGDTVTARRSVDELLINLGPSGPVAGYIGMNLFPTLVQLGDRARATDLLDRMPRGVYTWSDAGLARIPVDRLAADPRLRRIVEENRPPWVPSP